MNTSPILAILLCAISATLAACQPRQPDTEGPPLVVSTTTMLADLVTQVGGPVVRSRSIIVAGSDPHLYQPLPADAALVSSSAMVVRNGLHLEGWIDDLIQNAGGERPVVTASDGTDVLTHDGAPDPHFWFDADAWLVAVDGVTNALKTLVPNDADTIEQRAADYRGQVQSLDGWIETQIGTIPPAQRVLVTSHDAFAWFGRAYGLEVHAVQGVSTQQEASQRDVLNAVELVRTRSISAVFGETSVNNSLIEQVGRQAGVPVLGPLYSDSLGPADGPAATWMTMMSWNVCTIVDGLGGQCTPFVAAP